MAWLRWPVTDDAIDTSMAGSDVGYPSLGTLEPRTLPGFIRRAGSISHNRAIASGSLFSGS